MFLYYMNWNKKEIKELDDLNQLKFYLNLGTNRLINCLNDKKNYSIIEKECELRKNIMDYELKFLLSNLSRKYDTTVIFKTLIDLIIELNSKLVKKIENFKKDSDKIDLTEVNKLLEESFLKFKKKRDQEKK